MLSKDYNYLITYKKTSNIDKDVECHIGDDGLYWRHPEKGLHRLDGPAVIRDNNVVMWWRDDFLHRIDGPAIESEYEESEIPIYYLFGGGYDDENEYWEIVKNIPLLYWNRFKEEMVWD
jgi:hypothetical protein